MGNKNARLLQRITYVSRKPEVYESEVTKSRIDVRPTFAYNPESKTSPATAKAWAEQWQRDREYVAEPETHDNVPFKVRIVGLSVRCEGGRAYVVIDDCNRMFDLREDQLLEAFKRVGISPGGYVQGEFQWGVVGSQVKMALTGGDLHTDMVKGLHDKFTAATGNVIQLSSCVSGKVYRRGKNYYLYLGRIKRTGEKRTLYALVVLDPPTTLPYWCRRYDHDAREYVLRDDACDYINTTWDDRIASAITNGRLVITTHASIKAFHEYVSEVDSSVVASVKQYLHISFNESEYMTIEQPPNWFTRDWLKCDTTSHNALMNEWRQRARAWNSARYTWV